MFVISLLMFGHSTQITHLSACKKLPAFRNASSPRSERCPARRPRVILPISRQRSSTDVSDTGSERDLVCWLALRRVLVFILAQDSCHWTCQSMNCWLAAEVGSLRKHKGRTLPIITTRACDFPPCSVEQHILQPDVIDDRLHSEYTPVSSKGLAPMAAHVPLHMRSRSGSTAGNRSSDLPSKYCVMDRSCFAQC